MSQEFVICKACNQNNRISQTDGNCLHCGKALDMHLIGEGGPYFNVYRLRVITEKRLILHIEPDEDGADKMTVYAPVSMKAAVSPDGNSLLITDRPVEQKAEGPTVNSTNVHGRVGGDVINVGNISGVGIAIGRNVRVSVDTHTPAESPTLVMTVKVPSSIRKLSVSANGGTIHIYDALTIANVQCTNTGANDFKVTGGKIVDFTGNSENGKMTVMSEVTGDQDAFGDVNFLQ